MTDPEPCYICGLDIKKGDRIYGLKDSDGLVFLAHQDCVEDKMDPQPQEPE